MAQAESRAKYTTKRRYLLFSPQRQGGHGVEVPTVFGKPELGKPLGLDFDETFSRTLRDMWVQFARCGNPSLSAEASPDGKAKEWPAYDPDSRYVVCFDEDDVHVERESERGIVSWDKCYFLTRYYVI
jgi:para-nitrobenzyl esterase